VIVGWEVAGRGFCEGGVIGIFVVVGVGFNLEFDVKLFVAWMCEDHPR